MDRPIPFDTPGRARLVAELDRRGITQVALAAKLSVNQSTISNWFKGRLRPDADHRTQLHVVLGIAEDDWRLPEERARILAAMPAPDPEAA